MRFPKHKCGLSLEHNECRNYYETVQQFLDKMEKQLNFHYDWESAEHRQRSIETNEIWCLQWYANTPIGFNAVAAPTLDECLAFALTVEERDEEETAE